MIKTAPFHRAGAKSYGFTLVELLVALAVLTLLVGMLSQVMSLTSRAISINTKKLDAAGQARGVFDRLETDFASMPIRTDLGRIFTKASGNDSFQFYSEVYGYSGARQIAAVGYRIQQITPGRIYELERGAVGTDWGPGNSANPFVQFLPSELAAPAVSDGGYDVLATGVFRLEFCYLLNTGLMSNSPNSDYSNVIGYVVAIGILDNDSRKLVTSIQMQTLSGALPDDVDTNSQCQDPLTLWSRAMALPSFAAGVPPPVIQNVRIYQRIFRAP